MRRAAFLRTTAALLFLGFVLIAYLDPDLFLSPRPRAGHEALWFAIGLFAAGCAAKLTIPVKLFGLSSQLSAPLFVPLAAPYFLRLLWLDAGARTLLRLFSPQPPAPREPPRPRPYALPSRVATALAAAARARK